MMKSIMNKKVFFIALTALVFTQNNHSSEEEFIDLAETPGSSEVTVYPTNNCLGGFNNKLGVNFKEGVNNINGQSVEIGLGIASIPYNTDGTSRSGGKPGSWMSALRDAQMLAELRGKRRLAEILAGEASADLINEASAGVTENDRPAMVNQAEMTTFDKVKFVARNQLDKLLDLQSLDTELESRQEAIKDIVRQSGIEASFRLGAYTEISGMTTVYTNYNPDDSEFCAVVLKNKDSELVANAIANEQLNRLKKDASKAGPPLAEQLKINANTDLFKYGVRLLRDEYGEQILAIYVHEKIDGKRSDPDFSESKRIAEEKAKITASGLFRLFIDESVTTTSERTIESITTTYDQPEESTRLVEYFSDDNLTERIDNSAVGGTRGLTTHDSVYYENRYSGELVLTYIATISGSKIKAVMQTGGSKALITL